MKLLSLAIATLASLTSATALPPQTYNGPSSLAARAASPGCGAFTLLKGITIPRFIKSGTRSRSYMVHVPSSYDTNKAYPVVLGFHGSSSIGTFFEVDTLMSDAKYSGNVCLHPSCISVWQCADVVFDRK